MKKYAIKVSKWQKYFVFLHLKRHNGFVSVIQLVFFGNNPSRMKTSKNYRLKVKRKPRNNKVMFTLSDEEQELINVYLKKYKISNKTRWYRETVMAFVLKDMEQDYPTLFEENEMRR